MAGVRGRSESRGVRPDLRVSQGRRDHGGASLCLQCLQCPWPCRADDTAVPQDRGIASMDSQEPARAYTRSRSDSKIRLAVRITALIGEVIRTANRLGCSARALMLLDARTDEMRA